jgi:hypothetical protein
MHKKREGLVLDATSNREPRGVAPRIPALWVFALLTVSAVVGLMGVFWLKKASPILQVERRFPSVVAIAQSKGVEPTLLMAVCVTEKAFAKEKARSDGELATQLAKRLALAPKLLEDSRKNKGESPSKPGETSPEKKEWMHQILQKLLGSYEAASFAYDLEERHRKRWNTLVWGRAGKGN